MPSDDKPPPERLESQLHVSQADVNETGSLSVDRLTRYGDLEFVTKVYRGVLGREPDRMGLAHYLLELRSGLSDKIEILGDIRFSPEGKAKGVTVKGLLWPIR
jgi:hypothetical protein